MSPEHADTRREAAINAEFEAKRAKRAAAFRKLDPSDEPGKLQVRARKLADVLDALADALAAGEEFNAREAAREAIVGNAETLSLGEAFAIVAVQDLPDGTSRPRGRRFSDVVGLAVHVRKGEPIDPNAPRFPVSGTFPTFGSPLADKLSGAMTVARHVRCKGLESRDRSDGETVALPPNHPRTPSDIDTVLAAADAIRDPRALWAVGFRPGDLAKPTQREPKTKRRTAGAALLGCSDDTLRLTREKLGLAGPGKGQSGHRYTPEECAQIARELAENDAGDGMLRGNAERLLGRLAYTFGL